MYRYYNPNPKRADGLDCVVRAISKLTGRSWRDVYLAVCATGGVLGDMPVAPHVWGSYLRRNGCRRDIVSNACPDCYTVSDFAAENPRGSFILVTDSHAVAVIDGDWYDTWDSGGEYPIYYYTPEV